MLIELLRNKKGLTIIELMLTISLMGIVFILVYNLFFYSIHTFKKIDIENKIDSEKQLFLINIGKEIDSAKKANDVDIDIEGPIFIKNNKFNIYVDLDGDDKPEMVSYSVDKNKLIREVYKTNKAKYPYTDFNEPYDAKIVLDCLDEVQTIDNIFSNIKVIEKGYKDEKDESEKQFNKAYKENRKQVVLILKLKYSEIRTEQYEQYFFTKSKAEFE